MVSSAKVLPPSVEAPVSRQRRVSKKLTCPAAVRTEYAKEIEGRFWPKVKRGGEGECWPWQGSKTCGYGMIFAWGRPQYAHRIAYALQKGDVPEGMDVLHQCDNRPCCNAAHLFLGDQLANMQDRKRKGRWNAAFGDSVWNATITNETASAIYDADGLYREIAARYGVSVHMVGNIKRGRAWRRVTGGEPKRRYNNIKAAVASHETR